MNDPLPEHLQDLLWRANLPAEERARLNPWLAAHPGAPDLLANEAALTRALNRLPDAPVPSNFTARVLQAAERADRSAPLRPWWEPFRWLWNNWLPRTAAAVLVISVTWFGWQQHLRSTRGRLARSMAESVVVLTPEVMEDFDSIARLGSEGDQPLLAALELE